MRDEMNDYRLIQHRKVKLYIWHFLIDPDFRVDYLTVDRADAPSQSRIVHSRLFQTLVGYVHDVRARYHQQRFCRRLRTQRRHVWYAVVEYPLFCESRVAESCVM